MELTYKIMLYGGITGALITLPIAIWLFKRLDILDVLEDLTGLRMRKHKRNQNNAAFQMWYKQEHTSSSIKLKKLNTTNGSQSEQVSQVKPQQTYEQTELLEAENNFTEIVEEDNPSQTALLEEEHQTELLEETTLLANETELLGEENHPFVIEEDIVVVHKEPVFKEGIK
ncbi:hypothetical protein [Gracilibacillus massiliensis]|uniref:hypothetical protein n=1 Tax=Gracilibacillus massiliensis TaxID=1564956 RepID=UPI00071CE0F5|nr:hypothetical protein [Gracilibacillus massiliensis]